MLLLIAQVVTLIGLALWTLTRGQAADVGRIATGVGAIVWTILLLIPGIG